MSRAFHFLKGRIAFTLLELLVSMAVMAFVLVVVVSILNSTFKLTGDSNKRMDADSEARMVFDRLSGDFSRMVNRGDVDYAFNKQSGNDSLYFYSEAPASAGSLTAANNSTAALIGYRVNSNYQLERLGSGLVWSGTPSLPFLSYTAEAPDSSSTINGAFSSILIDNSKYQVLGENVFRLKVVFLLKPYTKGDGTVVPSFYSNSPFNDRLPANTPAGPGHTGIYGGVGLGDVQAVMVTLAILDSTSRKAIPANVDWSKIVEMLNDPTSDDLAASPPIFPATTWQNMVDSGGVAAAAGIPQNAVGQIRIYQRIFPLTSGNP